VDEDLVHEPFGEALLGRAGTEHNDVLSFRRHEGRGERRADVAGEEGDRRVMRTLWGFVRETEQRPGPCPAVGLVALPDPHIVGASARRDYSRPRADP